MWAFNEPVREGLTKRCYVALWEMHFRERSGYLCCFHYSIIFCFQSCLKSSLCKRVLYVSGKVNQCINLSNQEIDQM